MTTTLSPPKETTTSVMTTTVVTTTPPRSLPNWLRRVRDFWKSVPDESRLEDVKLQREQYLLRHHLR